MSRPKFREKSSGSLKGVPEGSHGPSQSLLRSCDIVNFGQDIQVGQRRHRLASLLTMTSIPKAVLYHYPGSIWSAVGNVLFIFI
jgi:hypothetical protein